MKFSILTVLFFVLYFIQYQLIFSIKMKDILYKSCVNLLSPNYYINYIDGEKLFIYTYSIFSNNMKLIMTVKHKGIELI